MKKKDREVFIEFVKENKKKEGDSLGKWINRALFTGICSTAFVCSAFDSRLKVQRYGVGSPKISTGFRIALLTDLHSCSYGEKQQTLLQGIYKENPDIVLLGGDIFDDVLPFDLAEQVVAGVSQKYPCYYVAGNHEYWSGDISQILRTVDSYGVHILSGTADTVLIKDNMVNICGISDPDERRVRANSVPMLRQLENMKETTENGNFSILLSHRPENISYYLEYDYDLMLSGHAHGGQWRIPGVLNGLYAPQQGLFPRYAGGEYFFDHKTFIVSRGLARETTVVPRIFNRPELVIIDVV